MLEALQPVALSERVYAELESSIVSCRLAPGEVLRDRQLSEILRVSRTPVREALQRLQAAGLVQPGEKGGWVVAGFRENDIRELFELRRALEPLGLEQMFKRADQNAIERLGYFFSDFAGEIPVERYPEYFERDHAFHKRIVACSSNSRLVAFYAIVEKQIHRGRHYLSTGYEGRVGANYNEHRDICRAIRMGDPEGAKEELVHHLRMGEELMIKFVKEKAQQV